MEIELQKVNSMENTFSDWNVVDETKYQVVIRHKGNAVIVPYDLDDMPKDELDLLDWLIEYSYNEDNNLSSYVDIVVGLPDNEKKLTICGNTYYAKPLKPIFKKHFGG